MGSGWLEGRRALGNVNLDGLLMAGGPKGVGKHKPGRALVGWRAEGRLET